MNLRDKLARFVVRLTKPRMITGLVRPDGIKLRNFRTGSTTVYVHPEHFLPEEDVFIGHHNFIEASHAVRIGKGTQLTNFISLTTHSSHVSVRLYGAHYGGKEMIGYVTGAVDIGEYCFIGPHSVIMPGSAIGKGSLVGAYSYVKGQFPDFSIIKGNPAKVVGDTRALDQPYFDQFPEIQRFYLEWAKTKPEARP